MVENVRKKADSIRSVIRYLQKFKNATIVIYLDDKVIDSPLFSSHMRDIALLHEAGLRVVIVPAARKRIDEVLNTSGIEWTFKDNVRLTSAEAIPLIKMAAFDVSNIVMTSLAANGITATIGNWVRSRSMGIIAGVDYGSSGEIEKLQIDAVNKILDSGFVPIFPCIGWSSTGHPYNISSVLLAQQVAIALGADKLFYVMEDGAIKSAEEKKLPEGIAVTENGDIAAMSVQEAEIFEKENPLVKLASYACKSGVTRVHIVDGKIDGVLPCEIFSNLGTGTMIYSSDYGKIRQMQQTDIPGVLRVIAPFVENGKLLARTEAELAAEINDFIVYEIDGALRACSQLKVYDKLQAEIAAVAVDENFSHMGIGPKMIETHLQKAKSLNLKSVFIMTTQASDWFEKLGFLPDTIDSLPPERRKIWSPERNSRVFRLTLK